ncbi:MAG: RimJ/RimL family protein N-acetyltransferase [Planctomycetota bacterium]|jgi:RimJ/RimL family protein N-acetyltransferase
MDSIATFQDQPPDDLRLEGELVALVPVLPGHAPALFEQVHRRQEVLSWLIWDGPGTVEDLEKSFAQWAQPSKFGCHVHLAILERGAQDRPVGTLSLRFQSTGVGDLGYWLGSDAWNRGLATEAISLVAEYSLLECGASALCAWVDVGNEASRRVLEKNGFNFERTIPGKAHKSTGPVDQWGFVLTEKEARRRAATSGH